MARLQSEEIVRAFDGHGERVEDPAELPGRSAAPSAPSERRVARPS